MYFLSIGPVLKLTIDTRVEAMMDKFYSPLLDSSDTPAWPIVRRYLRLWGLYHPIEDSMPFHYQAPNDKYVRHNR